MSNVIKNEPFDIEMEKFVLSSMFIKNGEIVPVVKKLLTVDDFYRPEHRLVYEWIMYLVDRNIEPNLLSLSESMREHGKLTGDLLSLILALQAIAHTTAYTEIYCKSIKKKSLTRQITRLKEQSLEYEKQEKDDDEIQEKINRLKAQRKILEQGGGAVLHSFRPEGDYYNNQCEKERSLRREFASRKTGFDNIDAQHVFAPELLVIGGLPGVGKSDMAIQWADNLADAGETVLYISQELNEGEIRARCDARALYLRDKSATLSAADIFNGGTSHTLAEIVEERKKSTRHFAVATGITSVDKICSEIESYCATADKPPIIFVDYLQKLPHEGDNEVTELGKIVYRLKKLQLETNSTIILLSSLNRQNYNSIASLDSLRGSGDIEFGADFAAVLQLDVTNEFGSNVIDNRLKFDEAMRQTPRKMEFRVIKNRHGRQFSAFFEYYGAHSYFKPYVASDWEENGGGEMSDKESADMDRVLNVAGRNPSATIQAPLDDSDDIPLPTE